MKDIEKGTLAELARIEAQASALLTEQSVLFRRYSDTASLLRRALRPTIQLTPDKWLERLEKVTGELEDIDLHMQSCSRNLQVLASHAKQLIKEDGGLFPELFPRTRELFAEPHSYVTH